MHLKTAVLVLLALAIVAPVAALPPPPVVDPAAPCQVVQPAFIETIAVIPGVPIDIVMEETGACVSPAGACVYTDSELLDVTPYLGAWLDSHGNATCGAATGSTCDTVDLRGNGGAVEPGIAHATTADARRSCDRLVARACPQTAAPPVYSSTCLGINAIGLGPYLCAFVESFTAFGDIFTLYAEACETHYLDDTCVLASTTLAGMGISAKTCTPAGSTCAPTSVDLSGSLPPTSFVGCIPLPHPCVQEALDFITASGPAPLCDANGDGIPDYVA
ncbi:MAG: hypothetical protein QOD77_615 [Thermoplasmata archaeon]|jgi:hypothetical protein|nr:hypothetical protein [Thermoplasmata archaeon]